MNKNPPHILIAEDDAFLLGMMQRTLTSHGVRVSTAANGKEAVDLIAKDPPDLLILDLLMPILDGFGVLEYRKDKKLHFPVFVCSNLSDKNNIIRCSEFDVSEYLIKSDMDDDQIWTAVKKYLH